MVGATRAMHVCVYNLNVALVIVCMVTLVKSLYPVIDRQRYHDITTQLFHPRPINRNWIHHQTIPSSEFSTIQQMVRGTYKNLKHYRELMERRVNVKPPFMGRHRLNEVPPALHTHAYNEYRHAPEKRNHQFDHGLSINVCPKHGGWVLLDMAKDMNNTEVIIAQTFDNNGLEWKQWFYTTTCDYNRLANQAECPQCCLAVDHNRFHSRCLPVETYVLAYSRHPDRNDYDWRFIVVKTGCSCAVTSKN